MNEYLPSYLTIANNNGLVYRGPDMLNKYSDLISALSRFPFTAFYDPCRPEGEGEGPMAQSLYVQSSELTCQVPPSTQPAN